MLLYESKLKFRSIKFDSNIPVISFSRIEISLILPWCNQFSFYLNSMIWSYSMLYTLSLSFYLFDNAVDKSINSYT